MRVSRAAAELLGVAAGALSTAGGSPQRSPGCDRSAFITANLARHPVDGCDVGGGWMDGWGD